MANAVVWQTVPGTAYFTLDDSGNLTITGLLTCAGITSTTHFALGDSDQFRFGDANDVTMAWDGTDFDVLPLADDSVFNFGNGTLSFDIKIFGNTASDLILFDASANLFDADGVDIRVKDADMVIFGDSSDVTITWDGTDMDILGLADDQLINIGNGTNDFDLKWFGNIATSYVYFDASADEIRPVGPIRLTSFNCLSRRTEYKWVAGQRGKPGINADIQNAAEAVRMIADPYFEILGVNATSGSTAFGPEGGIVLTTAGADGDEVILLPHLDANQSAWAQTTWGTDQQTEWECHIKSGANITNAIIWAGLKLTNTEVTATDNDQVFFRYEDDVNTGKFQAIESIGGVDTATDSAVTVAVSTSYHLKIAIDSARVARFYINGVLVRTSSALTNATDLIPYIGVAADGAAAAKVLTVYGQAISRTMA